jgi:hypothetical protein
MAAAAGRHSGWVAATSGPCSLVAMTGPFPTTMLGGCHHRPAIEPQAAGSARGRGDHEESQPGPPTRLPSSCPRGSERPAGEHRRLPRFLIPRVAETECSLRRRRHTGRRSNSASPCSQTAGQARTGPILEPLLGRGGVIWETYPLQAGCVGACLSGGSIPAQLGEVSSIQNPQRSRSNYPGQHNELVRRPAAADQEPTEIPADGSAQTHRSRAGGSGERIRVFLH